VVSTFDIAVSRPGALHQHGRPGCRGAGLRLPIADNSTA